MLFDKAFLFFEALLLTFGLNLGSGEGLAEFFSRRRERWADWTSAGKLGAGWCDLRT